MVCTFFAQVLKIIWLILAVKWQLKCLINLTYGKKVTDCGGQMVTF